MGSLWNFVNPCHSMPNCSSSSSGLCGAIAAVVPGASRQRKRALLALCSQEELAAVRNIEGDLALQH